MPIGVICNVLAVFLGGIIGAVVGRKLSNEFEPNGSRSDCSAYNTGYDC